MACDATFSADESHAADLTVTVQQIEVFRLKADRVIIAWHNLVAALPLEIFL
jgi:hypothetical protein